MLRRARAYLSVIFAIFARDVRRVLRNPVALVVVLGMAVMPSAYAWYVIAANWDPYNSTEGMKVAVANEDAGYDSDIAGKLQVGDQVIAQLRDNHELGWEFVDAQQAVDGVYSGEYWAAIVIPQDFSEDFASVFTGDFTRPKLDYYVNEKPSSIAPKVTDAGATALQKAIDENFVELVTERVVGTTQEVGENAKQKGDAAESSLVAGVRTARDSVAEASESLGSLQDTVGATKEAAASASSTLEGVQQDADSLEDSVASAKGLLAQARQTVGEYGSAVAEGAVQQAKALEDAASGASAALASASNVLGRALDETDAALARAEALLQANDGLIADLEQQASDSALATDPEAAAAVDQALQQARTMNDDVAATVEALRNARGALSDTAAGLEVQGQAVDDAAATAGESARSMAETMQTSVLPDTSKSLDDLVEAASTLQGALAGLSPSLAEARAILDELATMLASAGSSLTSTSDALGTMEDNLAQTLADLQALQRSSTVQQLAEYLKADPQAVGEFMASPVALDTKLVYPVRNYGSGVAPFFTNLALWVAGFILMAIVRLRVDPQGLPRFTATQAYFGRWLLYVVIGLAQGLVCCVGDLVIGIQCESPAAFIGAGLLTVFVDVNLMYALAFAFRHIGKAVAVILLILQIPGSSGMFPIEMMPAFFQAIHPLLPFTYSIDAMREAIGGFYGADYLLDMLMLALVFVPIGFAIGLGVGRADFNLNLMFDEKLARTDLFMAEPVKRGEVLGEGAGAEGVGAGAGSSGGPGAESDADGAMVAGMRFRKRTVIRALLDVDAFRESVLERARRFKRYYKQLMTAGWVALFVQPLITFALMVLVHADVDARVEMLLAMVVGIIVVDIYLIVLSFMNASLDHQLALASLDGDGVRKEAGRVIGAKGTARSGAEANTPEAGGDAEANAPATGGGEGGGAR